MKLTHFNSMGVIFQNANLTTKIILKNEIAFVFGVFIFGEQLKQMLNLTLDKEFDK
jgi:hypothetical protein